MRPTAKPRKFTSKQMGDACEMLVAAELTLAGVPALKVPDNWPHYDVVAQPAGLPPQRVSVKSRTWKRGAAYLEYNCHDEFDWLCAVILEGDRRRLFVIPRDVADEHARRDRSPKTAHLRYYRIDQVSDIFARWENNFELTQNPPASIMGDVEGGDDSD
ncbi:MAG: hypothetical protein CL955_09170 [Erythrobacteraceae bacterium]|nr:hypothetical protein [Erythrobacteraceae bacterium]